jgi:23S rRNA pseudouridine2604 synthase
MPIRNKLHYLLIKKLAVTKKTAKTIIESGDVFINEKAVFENCFFEETDSIFYKKEILQEGKKTLNIAFYKPRGIETTLNKDIEHNLKEILPFSEHLFPIGRLDKESEGLLILTNDGKYYRSMLHFDKTIEKEYIVKVDKIITDDFIEKMSSGIVIMGKTTLACPVTKIDDFTFNIVLVQGLNRQIRRMCYQLDYEVTELKRIRIGTIFLENLCANEYRLL